MMPQSPALMPKVNRTGSGISTMRHAKVAWRIRCKWGTYSCYQYKIANIIPCPSNSRPRNTNYFKLISEVVCELGATHNAFNVFCVIELISINFWLIQ